VDTTIIKDVSFANRRDPAFTRFTALSFGKRPAEELYDLAQDPHQINNVAAQPAYAAALAQLRTRVDRWMRDTADPRTDPTYDGWDTFPYYGKAAKARE
jgi:hypothetical protein